MCESLGQQEEAPHGSGLQGRGKEFDFPLSAAGSLAETEVEWLCDGIRMFQ